MAEVWSWNAGGGSWMTASNWTPNSVPGVSPLPYTDVRIGNLPGVQNSTVLLNHLVASGALSFDELHISSGMTLDTNGREIGGLNGITTLAGTNTELIVRPSTGPNFHDFTTRDLTMGTGTLLNLADNGRIRTGYLTSSGVIFGRGTVHVQGIAPGASLVNNGTISSTGNGGLTILQEGSGRFDLDGTSGNGQLTLAAPFSQLTFQGDTLADAFGGTVTMGSGSLLNMNMSSGWTADSNSTFNVSSSIVGAAAQIDGGHFTFGGDLNIGGSQGHLRVLADATLTSTADVFLGQDDRLEFDGATTVQGGVYNVSQGGQIRFDGASTILGGTFSTVSANVSDGSVDFAGPTIFNGTVNIAGAGRQLGNAIVAGPTVINANTFGMDGSGSTEWDINNALTVNADAIRSTGSNGFTGEMNIGGGVLGRLTMNLNNAVSWSMLGTMNLVGSGNAYVTRVAGDRLSLNGALNVIGGRVQITSDVVASSLAAIHVGPESAALRFTGSTSIDGDTQFSGQGLIANAKSGSMRIYDGAHLHGLGLSNAGTFEIGLLNTAQAVGLVTVGRFENTSTGVWGVDIGGYIAGTEHDMLLVTDGSATLDGVLTVSLSALGGGVIFAPHIGDEFTILSSPGGVSGAFANDPTSFANGLTYDWTVIYNPDTVVLRLNSIVPAPGAIATLGLGGLLAVRRRRTV